MEYNLAEKAGTVCRNVWDRLLSWARGVVERRGVLALPAMASVPVKVWFFYLLMGVKTNFFLVWLVTCALLLLLFTSTKHKWIPAVIYLAISVLMFADVAYSSFFNRYLSVNMLGAAGFLGDVGDSIKEVLRPRFFLLFVDTLLVFGSLIETAVRKRKAGEGKGGTTSAPSPKTMDEERNDVAEIDA